MTAVIAVDPGPETSALLEWFPERGHIGLKETSFRNEALCDLLEAYKPLQLNGSIRTELVVEKVVNYGMIVGAEVFETVFWSGRFCESWQRGTGLPYHRLPRMDVKMHLCHDSRAKDKNIRQALIDRFGPGKEKAIGLKYSPGPLYGVSGHCWAALALAVTWADLNHQPPAPSPTPDTDAVGRAGDG